MTANQSPEHWSKTNSRNVVYIRYTPDNERLKQYL
jgi:hypothetical protein